MLYIQQTGKHDCAFTCLEMLLANFHHDKNYLFIKHEDREYSFKELKVYAESYNLTVEGIKVEKVEELLKCKNLPLLVILETAPKIYHSVLLVKVNKKKVGLYDPSLGKKEMTISEFDEKWTHRALMIVEGTRMKRPDVPSDFIAKRDKLSLPFFQILSGLSLLFGTFFIDKNAYVFVPIILFSLFIIFELLFRDNLIKAMKRMDTEIESHELDGKNIDYVSLYENTEKYRYKALSLYPNVIYSLMITLFLTFILILNNPINIVYLAVSFMIAMIECVLLEPYFKNKAIEIGDIEKRIAKSESDDEYRDNSSRAREKAYSLGLLKTVSTYLGIAFLLLTSILIMALSQIVNITYIVFYLCISVFLKNNFSKIFLFSKDSGEADLYRSRIINYLKEEE